MTNQCPIKEMTNERNLGIESLNHSLGFGFWEIGIL